MPLVDLAVGVVRLHALEIADASRCGGRWCGPRPRSFAPAPDVPRRACRSGRMSRARIPAPAPPAPAASSPATGRRRRSAPPRGPRAAGSAESSSGRRAAWSRHRRRERARCRARPCAGSRRPAPPRSQAIEATTTAAPALIMNFRRSLARPYIFGIALGVADWVMPAAISSDEFVPFCQTGEARHGRRYRRCPMPPMRSVLDRLPMRDEDGQIRHEFVEEIARAIEAADAAAAARSRRRTARGRSRRPDRGARARRPRPAWSN